MYLSSNSFRKPIEVWYRITATSVMIDVGINNNDDVLDVLGGDIN